MQRRTFIKQASTTSLFIGTGMYHTLGAFNQALPARKFRISLNPGAIGVDLKIDDLLDMAIKYGYEAIVGNPSELDALGQEKRAAMVDKMKSNNMTWGSSGLPMDFRKSEEKFREDLSKLPKLAAICEEVGITRMGTWIMPTHPTLPYMANFEQHTQRLKATANVLGHFGIRLGLEYVGPKTLMARSRFPFSRTMQETKLLIEAIDEPNMGFVLDSFHWYCAEESAADILTLEVKDIVTVDFNDARAGLKVGEQIDGKRELPGATGVIDMQAFVGALLQIGYDGPIRAEPFNQPLRDMGNEDAIKTTIEAIKRVL